MMANLVAFIKFLLIFPQILYSVLNLNVLAIESQDQTLCVGKHQMDLDVLTDIAYESLEPIEYIDFDKMPSETIMQNDGQALMIVLKYNDSEAVPMIEVNFESLLGVNATFQLKFLYFQWFKRVPAWLAYEHLTFPVELHAVFYDESMENFGHAVDRNQSTNIVVLAFGIQVNPVQQDGFDVLEEKVKNVSESGDMTRIENRNLDYWLKSEKRKFYVYEGSFLSFNCNASVLWIDFVDTLPMKPEIVNEFYTATHGSPSTWKPTEILKPQGKVYRNFLPNSLAGSAPVPPLTFSSDGDYSTGSIVGGLLKSFGTKQTIFFIALYFLY